MRAVRRLVDRAVDEILLGEQRVTSAAEATRLLAGEEKSEALAGDVQRVVALAVPVARRLARGARVFKVPWVIVASTSVSVGFAVRTGVREIQALSSLLAYRLEQSTGAPSDPELVKKLAVDLYLNPKRTPRLEDDKLRFVRLTRKWLLSGAFGRKTKKRSSASARRRRADRHRGCRFAVGGAEAAQRPLTETGVLARLPQAQRDAEAGVACEALRGAEGRDLNPRRT